MKNIVKIPTTPNFIICNKVAHHISEYEEEALQKIGEAWIANLITKSKGFKIFTKEINL